MIKIIHMHKHNCDKINYQYLCIINVYYQSGKKKDNYWYYQYFSSHNLTSLAKGQRWGGWGQSTS